MNPVGIEKRRKSWGVYFDLPGSDDRKAVRESLHLASTQEERRSIEQKNGLLEQIQEERIRLDWKALSARFPQNEKLAALARGGALKMKDLFDSMELNWVDKKCRSIKDMKSKGAEVRAFFDDKYVNEVTYDLIDGFLRGLLKRIGPAAVNRKRAQIIRAFSFAVEKKRIKHDDVPGFPDKFEEPAAREMRWEQWEIPLLSEKLAEHLKLLPAIAGMMGWRISELLSRKKSDIRFDEGVVYLDALHSKNKEERYFPLIPPLRDLFVKQLEYVRRLEVKLYEERGVLVSIEWVFPNGDPRKPLGERMHRFDDALHTACEAAGLNLDRRTGKRRIHPETGAPINRGFHDFRRTAQDFLEEYGLTDAEIMLVVGHKTLSMRSRYKGKATADKARAAGVRLAAAIAAAAAAPSNVVQISDRKTAVIGVSGKLEETKVISEANSRAATGTFGDFVQPVYNGGVLGAENARTSSSLIEKTEQNEGLLGWAGSESNTRHKDFQS